MQGEPGYETDTGKMKIGNGQTPWNSLPYYMGVTGPQGATGPQGPPDGSAGSSGSAGTSGTTPANQVTGTGGYNYMAKWVTASQIGNSVIFDDGTNVGIGLTGPTYQLQLSTDSAAKPSTNTWTIASDARIKENIQPYTKGLEVLSQINPVVYDYNGKGGFNKSTGNVGIVAQDVADLLPESVSKYEAKLEPTDPHVTELLNFNSHALTYVLINAVKELNGELQALKSTINKPE